MIILWLSFWFHVAHSSCPETSLAEYEIRFETHWDKRDFPKHYPEWRPPASWSKLIGYSHNISFSLFHKGSEATVPFQHFVEHGNSDRLDLKTQGSSGIHDAFMSAPIATGVGETKTRFTTTGNHSKVSLASKITPSPDWFVGLDSYDLCPNGRWMEYIHLQAEPMDAGTDNGLTFTSPNWQTDPPEPIREITSFFPHHPAGSFYYPEFDYLPPISHFTLTKISEYSLKDKFDAADYAGHLYNTIDFAIKNNELRDQKANKSPSHIIKKTIDRNKNQVTYSSSENELPIEKQLIFHPKTADMTPWETNEINGNNLHKQYKTKLEDLPITTDQSTTTNSPEIKNLLPYPTTTTSSANFSIENHLDRRRMRYQPRQRLKNVKHKKRIPTGNAMAVIDNIVRKYQKEHRRQLRKRRRDGRKRRRSHSKNNRPPRDCRVSDWSEWSACSRSCGIGEKTRSREMVKRPRRGGKPCPSLKETTWCGSARACPREYFNWSF